MQWHMAVLDTFIAWAESSGCAWRWAAPLIFELYPDSVAVKHHAIQGVLGSSRIPCALKVNKGCVRSRDEGVVCDVTVLLKRSQEGVSVYIGKHLQRTMHLLAA